MHEFSTMQGVVGVIMEFAEKNNAKKVLRVYLDVGELTFLNHEQLKFSYQILSEGTILEGSELVISPIKAKYVCKHCGSSGDLPRVEEGDHFSVPVFYCPECGKEIEITSGRECRVREIEIET